MTDHHEHGTGLQDNTELLHRISTRLARTARNITYLPATTEHFANDRVRGLVSSLLETRGPGRGAPGSSPGSSASSAAG